MDVMRTVEDSFTFLEELGMRKSTKDAYDFYSYPSLPKKGWIKSLGNIKEHYFVQLNYHIIKEIVQPYQMDEPYVEIALLEESKNFISREENGNALFLPQDVSFNVLRPTGATGFIYCNHDTYCKGSSFIFRDKTCAAKLFDTIEKHCGKAADPYAIMQIAGNRCLHVFRDILLSLKNCLYTGEAALMFLNAKAEEILAALVNAIENLDSFELPQYTEFDRQAVQDIQKILRQSIQNPPSLRALAQQIGMNVNKMQEAFRHYTGVTVMDYLRSYRMQCALEFLLTDMLLDEIARRVGYRSASRFSEAFTKTHGILPSKYRKMLASQKENHVSLHSAAL
ncbi:MAG: helix-turn-helix transcriptional regulator [Oscillospiraceae bacterium]